MIEIRAPKPGAEKFIKRFETEHAPHIERGLSPEEAKEKIKLSLERIRKEVESTPEFQSEVTYHGSSSTLSDISNILSQDMLHDILIEHFFEALVQSGKIKLIK
jgi:hypothetical protein